MLFRSLPSASILTATNGEVLGLGTRGADCDGPAARCDDGSVQEPGRGRQDPHTPKPRDARAHLPGRARRKGTLSPIYIACLPTTEITMSHRLLATWQRTHRSRGTRSRGCLSQRTTRTRCSTRGTCATSRGSRRTSSRSARRWCSTSAGSSCAGTSRACLERSRKVSTAKACLLSA